MKNQNRRSFLHFLGRAGLIAAGSTAFTPVLNAFNTKLKQNSPILKTGKFPIKGILPKSKDEIVLAEGLSWQMLIKWQDPISAKDTFGFNNDYLAYLPFDQKNPNEGYLWVNHEYPDPLFISGFPRKTDPKTKTKEQVDKEMYEVGG